MGMPGRAQGKWRLRHSGNTKGSQTGPAGLESGDSQREEASARAWNGDKTVSLGLLTLAVGSWPWRWQSYTVPQITPSVGIMRSVYASKRKSKDKQAFLAQLPSSVLSKPSP